MASLVHELIEKYRKFILSNIEIVGHVESASRILSYVAPGGSATTSELLSAVVSLVVLVNDTIVRNAASMPLNFQETQKTIAFCLTVIEYVEVFLEMAAYGENENRNTARWIVVVGVQIIKALMRFVMLLKYDSGVVASSPIPSLKRSNEVMLRIKENRTSGGESVDADRVTCNGQGGQSSEPDTFTLKSTGRTVRSLSGGTSELSDSSRRRREPPVMVQPTKLNDCQIFAESLHILRPLLHLGSMYIFGQSSWKPWIAAFGIDLTSVLLMGDSSKFNAEEREEMKRRAVMMLLYLLRSPFYDRYSRAKLLIFLGFLANKVPLVRIVARPILEYLPIWQQVYFYVWAV